MSNNLRIANRRPDIEDLPDAVAGDGCPGDHDEHHGDKQERNDDVHRILQEGEHVADEQILRFHHVRADPHDEDVDEVHHDGHRREQERHAAVDEDVDLPEFHVGHVKALFLRLLRVECTDDKEARKPLCDDLVEPVELALQDAELGHHREEHEHHDADDDRQRQPDRPRQRGTGGQRADQRPDAHDRREDRHAQSHDRRLLDLLNVVGRPCDERRGAETVEFRRRKVRDVREQRPPDIAGCPRRRAGREKAAAHREQRARECQPDHDEAGLINVRHVHRDDAVVDDIRHVGRQRQFAHRLAEQQQHDQQHVWNVWFEIPQRCLQGIATLLSDSQPA